MKKTVLTRHLRSHPVELRRTSESQLGSGPAAACSYSRIIYMAGDLADPHGTHRVCTEIALEALEHLKLESASWVDECHVWMYRGAWMEWELVPQNSTVVSEWPNIRPWKFS